jgi:hypothetical protein
VIANLAVDLLYSILDPRVRVTGRGDTLTEPTNAGLRLRPRASVRESTAS